MVDRCWMVSMMLNMDRLAPQCLLFGSLFALIWNVHGQTGASLSCGPPTVNGSSLLMTSSFFYTQSDRVLAEVTWNQLSVDGQMIVMATCSGGVCSHNLPAEIEMIDDDGIWRSTIIFTSVPLVMGGPWSVKWEIASQTISFKTCQVYIKPFAPELSCPLSDIGYPFEMTATSGDFIDNFVKLEWYKGPVSNRALFATCTTVNCTLVGDDISSGSIISNNKRLMSMVFTLVGKTAFHDEWTTVWHYTGNKTESAVCVAVIQDKIPYQWGPLISPPLNWQLNSLVLVTMTCDSGPFDKISVSGNYSSILQEMPNLMPLSDVAQFKLKMIRTVDVPTILRIDISSVIRRVSTIYTAFLHINFTPKVPQFVQPMYAVHIDEYSKEANTFPLAVENYEMNDFVEIQGTFPQGHHDNFEIPTSLPVLRVTQELPMARYSLFQFKVYLELRRPETNLRSYGMFILYPDSMKNRYPLNCLQNVTYQLTSNTTRTSFFTLPCTVYDRTIFDIIIVKAAKDLRIKDYRQNLLVEVENYFPIGVKTDDIIIAAVDKLNTSHIYTPSIHIHFMITRIPPTPVYLRAQTTSNMAEIYVQVAPTIQDISELITKGVILGFRLVIDFDGVTITTENYATVSENPNDLGQIVYNITGLKHSTEYTGHMLTLGVDVSVVESQEFSFTTAYGLPQPMYLRSKSLAKSVQIHIRVAPTIKILSQLITDGIIKSFHLDVLLNGDSITVEKGAFISEEPNDDGIIVYTVWGFSRSTYYTGRFMTVGSSTTLTTQEFGFLTVQAFPIVRSSQPSIVAMGDVVNLNCSSKEKGDGFKWFHNSGLLEDETNSHLSLVASINTSGVYQCQMFDKNENGHFSNEYNLTVRKPEDIAEFTAEKEITLQRPWMDALSDPTSFEFSTMKFYMEKLIESVMLDRPNFVRSKVISFRKGSIIAKMEMVERVMYPGDNSDIVSYLNTELKSGVADSFQLNDDTVNLQLTGIDLKPSAPDFVQEGSRIEIDCRFVISHSVEPTFGLVWVYNGSVINQEKAKTFTFPQGKVSVFSRDNGWGELGSLSIYHYSYKLQIKEFPPRLIGTFECQIDLKMSNLPSNIINMEKYQSLNITYYQILRQPKVLIYPPSFQVPEGSSASLTIYCIYSNADNISLLNEADRVIGFVSQPSTSNVSFQNRPEEKNVRCLAESVRKMEAKSDPCHIYIIKKENLFCDANKDRKDLQWEKSAEGTTSVKNCPPDYLGLVTRKCAKGGQWQESNYINCAKEQLEIVKEEIKNINEDGFQATPQQIKSISSTVNTSITGPASILSGDIVQVVEILSLVGKAVSDDDSDDDKAPNLVDTATLENFANAADAVLSTEDSEWVTITNTEMDETGSEESSGIGPKLVVALDILAASSLSNTTYSTEPIIKKNVVIKRDTFAQKDIVFPEENDKNYDKYGGWVVKSSNKAFLSAQNFGNVDEKVQYAIVLFNGVDSKFVVDYEEQKKYSIGEDFKYKTIASDIISFSLSLGITSFSSPLKLDFQITKENLTRPLCGFLDTSLGSKPVWSSKGCQTTQLDPDLVECRCSHLTNFAILMSPYGTSEEHHEILSIVTYVGCGISILCLVITIVMHAVTWKYSKEDRTILHLHLSVILILAYITFLAGINQTDHDTACTTIAGLLHFLFLTVFFIMLAEGIQVLITVTFVFSKESYLWKLLLMAYICPLVVVGVCLGITQTDGYRSSDFCWLNIDNGFLWAFVGPALLVILINLIIMIATLRTMMNMVSMRAKKIKVKAKKALRAIIVLTPLFGITWVFGVFSVNESLVVFQYLFAIFNCLQGFFVFLFYVLLCNQIKDGLRHMLRKYKSRSFGTEERMFVSSDNQNSESSPRKQSSSDQGSNMSTDQTGKTGMTDAYLPRLFSSSKQSGIMNPSFHGDGWKNKSPETSPQSNQWSFEKDSFPREPSNKSGFTSQFVETIFNPPPGPSNGLTPPQTQHEDWSKYHSMNSSLAQDSDRNNYSTNSLTQEQKATHNRYPPMMSAQARDGNRSKYSPKLPRDAYPKDAHGRRGGVVDPWEMDGQGNDERRLSLPGMDRTKQQPYGAMTRKALIAERFKERVESPQGGFNESLWY